MRQPEEQYRILFETMALGVVYQNAQGEIISANPAAETILGITLDQMQDRTSLDPRWKTIHPDGSDFPSDVHPAMIALKTGRPIQNVIMGVFHPQEQAYHWILVSAIPQFKPGDPTPYQVYTTFSDITELKQAESKLYQQHEVLQTILDNIPVMIAFFDQQGNYKWVNRCWEQTLGWSLQEVQAQKNVLEELYPDPEYRQYVINFIYKSERIWGEFITRVRDGRMLNTTWTNVAFSDDSHIGIGLDMTEHKRVEQKIRQLNERLEERVQQRTAELEKANKDLETFTYSVSHDLHAPLRHITGFAHILEKDYAEQLGDTGKEILNVITGSVRRMQDMIDALLAFSRSGRKAIRKTAVDMMKLVHQVFEEVKPQDREIRFILHPLPSVVGDLAMLHQVWLNLLTNAIKFSAHQDSPCIEIGSKGEQNEKIFYIQDNGVGFDMQYVGKIFDVFQRLHSSRDFEGNGVGLAIVQRIIERHGGRVWAQGQVNQGATFYFTLSAQETHSEE
ncbi:MAG: ATP-binding protein [Candidatus Vecturithrix sp.]|jgi:PAS domain S-box-containing protein|nr:ATP-binding protein [Candidatus Vecturithrix sp.]